MWIKGMDGKLKPISGRPDTIQALNKNTCCLEIVNRAKIRIKEKIFKRHKIPYTNWHLVRADELAANAERLAIARRQVISLMAMLTEKSKRLKRYED